MTKLILLLFATLWLPNFGESALKPIKQEFILFHQECDSIEGESGLLLQDKRSNISTNVVLVDFLPSVRCACFTGQYRWRFYAYENFTDRNRSGYTFGDLITDFDSNNVQQCQEFDGNAAGWMASYRYLGPPDLCAKTISLYSEPNFGGQEVIVTPANGTILNLEAEYFVVKSYLITAETDADRINTNYRAQVPVWVQSAVPDGATNRLAVCMVLRNSLTGITISISTTTTTGGIRAKRFGHPELVDGFDVGFKSLKYLTDDTYVTQCVGLWSELPLPERA